MRAVRLGDEDHWWRGTRMYHRRQWLREYGLVLLSALAAVAAVVVAVLA